MKTHSIVLVFTLISIITIALVVLSLWQPVDKNNKEQVVFVVYQGEGVNAIARRLEQEGLIRNRFVFILDVKRLGIGSKIQAGDFRLSKSEASAQIAEDLTKGTLDIWVQIIEGRRAEEIAAIFKEKISTYENAWVLQLRKNEGHLFPDTYLIPKDANIELVLKILKSNFEGKLAGLQSEVGKNGLSLEESLTLASIVEREAQFDSDRPIVAGILLNRLNAGIALQADATVQYALGFQPEEQDWWKKHLTKEDLTVNSPYNTYKFPGLPPKPISNPGLAALKAVLNPADTDYLYYISDKEGYMHYAKTLDGHNENINKYL